MRKYYPELIIIILLAYLFKAWLPSTPWNRMIIGDGKGYYAYLPALFIYNDPSYGFTDETELKHYPTDKSLAKGFKKPYHGNWVNQYFCGMAILWLPFFILSHILSLAFGLDTDGYSIIYQFSIGISALFYLYIGIRALRQVLAKMQIGSWPALLSIVAIVFGSNLFHYTVEAPFMSHVYSFSLLSMLLLVMFRLKENNNMLLLGSVLYALIILVRPTNAIVLLLFPFVLGGIKECKKWFKNCLEHHRLKLILSIIIGLVLLYIQPLLWKWQTGDLFVYSYAEEGFNFDSPQMLNALFSIRKGWFVYTPLAFVSLAGFINLYRNNKFRFTNLLFFWLIAIYIISSWHLWAYADSFGQRPFVDYYSTITILLGFTIQSVKHRHTTFKWLFAGMVVFIILLNQVQNYQLKHFVIPSDNMTIETYKSTFFKFTTDPLPTLADKGFVPHNKIQYDLEDIKSEWSNWENSASTLQASSGKYSSLIGTGNEYSITYRLAADSGISAVAVDADIYCNVSSTSAILVIDVQSQGNTVHYYNTPLEVKERNEWVNYSFGTELQLETKPLEEIVVYFWLPDAKENEAVYIDDIVITTYRRGKQQTE